MKEYARKYNTPEYRKRYTGMYGSWYAMKQRCTNPNNAGYKNYGGRGIGYPKAWEAFAGFSKDMSKAYKKGLTLERIDNNSGYSKENCRWATRQEQAENKRCNISLQYAGQSKTLIEWSKQLDIPYKLLRHRYYRGWATEKIIETEKLR